MVVPIRKTLSVLILLLLLLGFLGPALTIGRVNARILLDPSEEDSQLLPMRTWENVAVFEDGTCRVTIEIKVPSSPLADMYRKMLGAPENVAIEEEMPIPENVTEIIDAGEDSIEIPVPVRQEFYKSLLKEQLLSLGIDASITDSRMVPRGIGNECRIMLDATGSFATFNVSQITSEDLWQLNVGPLTTTGITGLTLSKLVFTQSMLKSLSGEQRYESHWQTRIVLPAGATLQNENELQDSWEIDLGGGTCLSASVSLDEKSAIRVEEHNVVRENNITATPEYLRDGFLSYKNFDVKYFLPRSSNKLENGVAEVNTNWNVPCETGWINLTEIPLSYSFEKGGLSLDAKLYLTPKFKIIEDIGWQWHWQLAWPPIKFDKFWANTTLQFECKVRLEITSNYTEQWERTIYQKNLMTFYLYFGVPIWIDLRFGVDLTLSLDVEASFAAESTVSGSISTGAIWDASTGWSQPIDFHDRKFALQDFEWYTSVNVTVIPSARFRLEFMFFSVAGPFVEFEPYFIIDVTTYFPANSTVSLELSFNFKINVGVRFDPTIEEILRLLNVPEEVVEPHRWPIYDVRLWNQSWNWVLNETSETPFHDLGITDIMSFSEGHPERGYVFPGEIAVVNVTARNIGDYNETSGISLFQNDLPIGNYPSASFLSHEDVNSIFRWNTSGLTQGNYTLSTRIEAVENESNFDNNVMNITLEVVEPIDVALTGLYLPSTEVYTGQIINFTVTVKNLGNATESFNVTAYCNDTSFGIKSGGLAVGQENAFIFQWNTTNINPNQTRVLWAEVNTTHFDINMTNNRSEFVSMLVKLFGDVDNDEFVNMRDVLKCIEAFNSFQGKPRWNPSADLDQNGRVDTRDILIVLLNYGKHV